MGGLGGRGSLIKDGNTPNPLAALILLIPPLWFKRSPVFGTYMVAIK